MLILSNSEDYHAFVIAEALTLKGVAHQIWHTADFPSLQRASVWLGPTREECTLIGPELLLSSATGPKTVWFRRPERPVVPADIDEGDRLFAYRECKAFLDGVRQFLGAGTFWVNPPAGFARSNLKIEQLRSATRVGLPIPDTLMSNDPEAIRSFISAKAGKVIYKAFFPFAWRSQDGIATLFSSAVSLEDLPEDSVLAAVPGIFQGLVDKAYELRVTVMGHRLFAVKIYSQEVPSAQTDWRAATEHVRLEPFTLPRLIEEACHAVMHDLGIVFGCFDLIVTPTGDFVFLEVNEAGAFLWLEEELPELLLADAFCEFLCQEQAEGSPRRPVIKLADVHDSALRRMKESAPLHVHEPEETPHENLRPSAS